MELHKKTLLILVATILCLIFVLYLSAQTILLAGFAELEQQDAEQNVVRVEAAMLNEITRLDHFAYDWGAWDDTYEFVEYPNDEYIDSNLLDETFIGMKLNVMLFVNSSGGIVYGKAVDYQDEEEVPVPQGLYDLITNDSFILDHQYTNSSISGLILLPEGPMLIASRPIVTSQDQGPIKGTLVMCRYFDSTAIEAMSETTQLSFDVYRFNDQAMPLDVSMIQSSLSETTPILVKPLSEQSIAGYTLINDVYGDPALVLRVNLPRGIYEQGQITLSYFIASILIAGLVFGAIIMIILEKSILSRLSRLGEDVNFISSSGDISSRVSVGGDDELSLLAGEINFMLDTLHTAENQLQNAMLNAEAANRSKDEFLANMSHELRTPLNSIVGFSDMLLEQTPGPLNKKQEKYIRNVSKSGKHLLCLINGILDLSKVEAGKMELHYEQFKVSDVIYEVRMIIAPLISEKELKLEINIDPQLSTIVADRVKFIQIIYNLVSNSIKFTHAGGTVSIEAQLDGGMVHISVEDTGIGISEEEYGKLFQPFTQVDSTANRQYAGTGLGLTLVKHFVEIHGGKIWFESELGKGTKFTFTIPVEKR